VANAIEDWFQAYDKADANQPLLERIPRNETSNVAAKWLWFGFFTTLIGILFSSLVAGVTAWFLYKQTKVFSEQTTVLSQQAEDTRKQTTILSGQATVLAEQAKNTRETDTNAQRTQYAQILYDEKCDSNAVGTICKPIHNKRIRSEAAQAFLKLERLNSGRPDFSDAQLGNVDFIGIDLSDVNFIGANLGGANLTRANLHGANISNANLSNTNLHGANINDANLHGANLTGANLIGADLSGTDLIDAELSGADLSDVRNVIQDMLDRACGNEGTKLPDGLSIVPCKTN